MKSLATPDFWRCYHDLPIEIQKQADKAYLLWQINPYALSLYFKRVGKQQPVYSVRIGKGYRALGLQIEKAILWFWIGEHDEYERMLKSF